MKFHDAHCHISRKSFLKNFDFEKSMKGWIEMGLECVIGVSTKLSDSIKTVNMSKEFDEIIPAIGIHPWSAKNQLTEEAKSEFDKLIELCDMLVIGEIGLDHHFIKNEELYTYQEATFRHFLDLAEKNDLPINVHLKGAEEEGSEILTSYDIPSHNILIHWFSGSSNILRDFIDRDYFFTVNPSILGGSPHVQVLERVPFNRILTESDGDVKYTIDDERVIGSPGIIPKTLKKISDVRKETISHVAQQLQMNLLIYLNRTKV